WQVANARAAPPTRQTLTLDETRLILQQLVDTTPVKTIAVSGGEPFMSERLEAVVQLIEELGLTWVILSNGTLISESRMRPPLRGGTYEVPLLAAEADIHDSLVGVRGAWRRTLEGVSQLMKPHSRWIAVFVSTRQNASHLAETVDLAVALGAQGLMFNRLNLGARHRDVENSLLPSRAMLIENLDILNAKANEYELPVAVSVVIEPCVIDVSPYQHVKFGWCPLAGEDAYFTIDPSGNLRICNHSPTVLGNLLEERFVDIYRGHPYVTAFRERLPDECRECPDAWRTLCRGGCKAAAEQWYGTIEHVDPFVTLMGMRRQ
ncbi:MAG: radical SAM protein, partial [Candidatus Bipolaricaulota bacterium]|nr:radical SAM protein [Candidatus Bipolaricaulota bacterium]